MSWLLESNSDPMFGYISKCSTSTEIWNTIQNYFISKSKVRIMHLRNTLQTLKKGNLNVHIQVC